MGEPTYGLNMLEQTIEVSEINDLSKIAICVYRERDFYTPETFKKICVLVAERLTCIALDRQKPQTPATMG
ncbi:MAG: hypothetical protein JWR18_2158 [Segetibacter sp.]|jgi:hypothetical protein|nr:hypothetical protein [Segetibacter sp.]